MDEPTTPIDLANARWIRHGDWPRPELWHFQRFVDGERVEGPGLPEEGAEVFAGFLPPPCTDVCSNCLVAWRESPEGRFVEAALGQAKYLSTNESVPPCRKPFQAQLPRMGTPRGPLPRRGR